MFPLKDNIPTIRFPVVTVTLIALNVIAYFFWQRGGLSLGDPSSPRFNENLVRYSSIPFEISHPGHIDLDLSVRLQKIEGERRGRNSDERCEDARERQHNACPEERCVAPARHLSDGEARVRRRVRQGHFAPDHEQVRRSRYAAKRDDQQ